MAHPFPVGRNLGRNSSPFLLPQPLLSEVVLLLQDQCFRLNIHFCPSSSRHLTRKVKYYACKSVLALGGFTETSRALCCVLWACSPLHPVAGTQEGGWAPGNVQVSFLKTGGSEVWLIFRSPASNMNWPLITTDIFFHK